VTQQRRVLVTGGAGFIGANLCRDLAAAGDVERIVVLDDLSTGLAENLSGVQRVEFVQGSILDPGKLAEACRGCDAIVHLAARPSVLRSLEDPLATHEVNATGTLRVLEAARHAGTAHVVVASSSSVYGANRSLPAKEKGVTLPLSPYGASKLAAEAYALAYQRSFGLPVLALRFFNVFGPLQRADHDYAAVVPAFVRAALAHTPLPVHGDGQQTRDFTYVKSVTRVLGAALRRSTSYPGPVNLAFGTRRSVLDLVDALQPVFGEPLPVRHLDPRPGDVRDSQADQTRLRSLFPELEPVPLLEGLAETVRWFRSTGQVPRPVSRSDTVPSGALA